MYDQFSVDYDRFVNWPSRLAYELPLIERQLQTRATGASSRPLKVLDTACGTGMHAIALAQRGYSAAGADLSAGMIAQAQSNAAAAGVEIPFLTAGFGDLSTAMRSTGWLPADALLCLGNSLPHLLSLTELRDALLDFAACLRPGGLLLIQNRNFDAVSAEHSRWMEPQAHRSGADEWVFVRFYDFEPAGTLAFNILTLRRTPAGAWQQQVTTTRLRPLLSTELLPALAEAGFTRIQAFGDMTGLPFDHRHSPNLIIIAQSKDGQPSPTRPPEDAMS